MRLFNFGGWLVAAAMLLMSPALASAAPLEVGATHVAVAYPLNQHSNVTADLFVLAARPDRERSRQPGRARRDAAYAALNSYRSTVPANRRSPLEVGAHRAGSVFAQG